MRFKRKAFTAAEELLTSRDRGKAAFFHGRLEELAAFDATLVDARRYCSGAIWLVQGPPGAGKTALLHECSVRARRDGWRVAFIMPRGLYDCPQLVSDLRQGSVRKSTRFLGIKRCFGPGADQRRNALDQRDRPQKEREESIIEVLRDTAKRRGLVLILDEVQVLEHSLGMGSEVQNTIRSVLKQIQNGDVGTPVVLGAGGLGSSQKVLYDIGVRRFAPHCLHNLGRLSANAAKCVIKDWLVNAGLAPDDHPNLALWVAALASESYGWPLHLQAYAQIASQWLYDNGNEPTPQVPSDVFFEARRYRREYYEASVDEFSGSDIMCLVKLLRQRNEAERFTRAELVEAFTGTRTIGGPEFVIDKLLHKGVVAKVGYDKHQIPIPSMRDWLVGADTATASEIGLDVRTLV